MEALRSGAGEVGRGPALLKAHPDAQSGLVRVPEPLSEEGPERSADDDRTSGRVMSGAVSNVGNDTGTEVGGLDR